MEEQKTPSVAQTTPKRRGARWWPEILIAIAVVLVIVGIAIPAYNLKKTEARRAEAKKGLHDIQIAVERFATDGGGTYPEYLIGGSAPVCSDPKNPFALASDPLIRKGYLTSYPRNPFAVPKVVLAMQQQYNDPFRLGTSESKFGYRFGEDYTLMGQVLADFRYPKLPGQKMVESNGVHYYADTEYPFWDVWPQGAKKPKPFLPGEFFYKSTGDIVVEDEKELDARMPATPAFSEIYVLGLYGAVRDRGKDVLGAEFKITLESYSSKPKKIKELSVPAWTRSTMTPNEEGEYLGSPFHAPHSGDNQAAISSPNGIPDGIILCVGTMYPE